MMDNMFLKVLLELSEYLKNNEIDEKIVDKLFFDSKYGINKENRGVFFICKDFEEEKKKFILKYEIEKLKKIKKEKFFILIEFFFDEDFFEYDENIEEIKLVRDTIRRNLQQKFNEKYQILYDYLAFYLLKKSYPLVYEIENSLRELIYLTMTVMSENDDWFQNEVPDNIHKEIPKNRKSKKIYGSDFKHLSEFLFERSQKGKAGKLFEKIEQLRKCNEIILKELKNLVPMTNWKKYFTDLEIDKETINDIKKEFYKNENLSDDEVLKKLLEDINTFRNKVAHNDLDIENDFFEKLERRRYYFIQWVNNAREYILEENKKIIKSIQLEKLDEINKKQLEEIDDLLKTISEKYKISHIDISEIVKRQIVECNENSHKCNILKKLKYIMELKKSIESENKIIDKNDFERNNQDIDDILNNLEIIFEDEKENIYDEDNILEED